MGGLFVVYSDCKPGTDEEFNRWYDEVHIPDVLAVGPIVSAQRYRVSESQNMKQERRYLTIYEYEGDPQKALDALLAGADTMEISDTLTNPFMTVIEDLRPRQHSD